MSYNDFYIVKNKIILICLVKYNEDKYLFTKQVFFLGVSRGYIRLPERLGTEKMKLKTGTDNRNRHEKQFKNI